MAAGKLNVTPVTVRGLPAGFNEAKLFIGCFIQESEKHRTHAVNGPEPTWSNTLTCTVPEGEHFLHVELVNESPNNGGILATANLALNQVFDQGKEQKWVTLNSSNGQSFGQLQLDLVFNGTNSVSSVTGSFSNLNMAGGAHQVAYQQTTTTTSSAHHSSSDSRQGSFASLGPANPIPSNYGAGSPPPFTPPAGAAISAYPNEKSGPMPGQGMPGVPSAGGMATTTTASSYNIENLSKDEFEDAKAKGNIPNWMKYGGGVLASAAAIGLTAWGAHELKEHFEEQKEEERRKHQQEKPHHSQQNLPYTIHNQEGHSQPPQHQQSYPAPPHQQYAAPPPQHYDQHHEKRSEEHHKKKKEKKHNKHRGSGSDSSSSDSDSSDDEKKKHHKKKDSDWH